LQKAIFKGEVQPFRHYFRTILSRKAGFGPIVSKMKPSIKGFLQKLGFPSTEKTAAEAYDIWSDTYDFQPGNLMLDLDEIIFSSLIRDIDLKNKRVADVGCGTGRHWQKIYAKDPDQVLGFDISPGMLHQLSLKFPSAVTQLTTDNLLRTVPDCSIDCLVTTLTIAHIKQVEEVISTWSRVLKNDGHLIITDFHPQSLAKGGKRSFPHAGKSLSVTNYVHPLEKVKNICLKYNLFVVRQEEKNVNQEVRSYYESRNALHIYERFMGIPIIYGLCLKKLSAAD
jgi:ubiquinone/menaquinone biosynthesis C-methylase UbiE